MKKKVGLFFGSFNPVHIGHMIMANYILEHSFLEEIWMVVSPHNPLKNKSSLLEDYHRLAMLERACEPYDNIRPSNIEFNLPQPSYTVNTLAHLSEKFSDLDFSLIMGEDSLASLYKWKNYEVILEAYSLVVYPRNYGSKTKEKDYFNQSNIHRVQAPIIQLSATQIRRDIKEGKNVRAYMPLEAWEYMDQMNFYRQ